VCVVCVVCVDLSENDNSWIGMPNLTLFSLSLSLFSLFSSLSLLSLFSLSTRYFYSLSTLHSRFSSHLHVHLRATRYLLKQIPRILVAGMSSSEVWGSARSKHLLFMVLMQTMAGCQGMCQFMKNNFLCEELPCRTIVLAQSPHANGW